MEIKEKWYRQTALKKRFRNEEVPSIDEMSEMIGNIKLGKENPAFQTRRAKALIAMYYLTAARVSELLPDPSQDFVGITKRKIKYGFYKNKKVMYLRPLNRKNKDRETKQLPIPIEFEKQLVDYIEDYIQYLNDEDVLFTFGKQRAIQIINQTIKFNAHFIRHIRLTHLITIYDFNSQALIKFAGWTDIQPAKYYMELSSKDILNQFYKNEN